MRKGQLELRKPFPRASADRVEAAQPEYRLGGKRAGPYATPTPW